MAHIAQIEFCQGVKKMFPQYFKGTKVLDVGSLDINGNNRYLFEDCEYIGIDLGPGKNVDVVAKGHEYQGGPFDVVISTESLEHDQYWCHTIENSIRLLKQGGLYLFTCASTDRPEHGTSKSLDWASPYSHVQFNDYYRNLNEIDIRSCVQPELHFMGFAFTENKEAHDLYFWGIKKWTAI